MEKPFCTEQGLKKVGIYFDPVSANKRNKEFRERLVDNLLPQPAFPMQVQGGAL